MVTTSVFEANAKAWLSGKRRALNEGGTSSSKTMSIIQLCTLIAEHSKAPLLISIVSESFPHLRRGCIRDFFNIMGPGFEDARWSKSTHTYEFDRGMIEFFSADEPSKMRGGRRDILFENECNNIPYEAHRELDIRTRRFTFMDWNPVGEFWAHEQGMITNPENAYIHSTYRDAIHVLPPEVVANIEINKDRDPNWWNIYGLGLLGKIEGLVYPYFSQVDVLPDHGDVVFGLDFGFSGDPAALTKNVITTDSVYSRELFYERNLTNQDIAQWFADLGIRKGYDEIIADSSEPKSIEEIYRLRYNIKACDKGADSVEYGHQKVRQLKQFWTKDSLNCIKEQRNFRYVPDKNGKLTEKTTHQWSHGMDSRRYAVMAKAAKRTYEVYSR